MLSGKPLATVSFIFNCTVYDVNGKVNSRAGFIGNINPFRWKGFYYDAESGLYYANGSYYDPTTGLYVDSAPIDGVMENALSNNLDRNGLMCNNILELACNPSTIFNVTELTADPTYDVTDKFPDWMKRQIKRQERINKILRWYQDLHWGWKLGVGIALLIGAIGFTVATGGGGAGVISVLVQTAIGVGVGVGLYTVGSLMSESFTVEGLADAALNAFLITSATVFISSGINAIKHLCRSKTTVIDGVQVEYAKQSDFSSDAWDRIKSLEHRADGSTVSSMKDGRLIHKGFKSGFGKEYRVPGVGRFDFFNKAEKIIYELKPNNSSSIIRGIQQLHRYNTGLGGGYKLVLVLY